MRIIRKTIIIVLLLVLVISLIKNRDTSNTSVIDNTVCDELTVEELQLTNEKEIVCWGDSLTRGSGASEAEIYTDDTYFDASYLSYPEILQQLTGITAYNFGTPGATSEEIAIMQGGISPERELDSYDMIDCNVMEQSKKHKGDIVVLEIGSNGGWDGDYDTLISQYDAMIAYAGSTDYIIIGDTDDPLNSVDTRVVQAAAYNDEMGTGMDETPWEAVLRENYGDHFINMRAFMIENGLSIAGLTETEEDIAAERKGNISSQLRTDWTHFNSYGYYVQAVAVYQKGVELGYWN